MLALMVAELSLRIKKWSSGSPAVMMRRVFEWIGLSFVAVMGNVTVMARVVPSRMLLTTTSDRAILRVFVLRASCLMRRDLWIGQTTAALLVLLMASMLA